MQKTLPALILSIVVAAGAGILHARAEQGAGAQAADHAFRHCDACPLMIRVPAGEFIMGSDEDEADRDDDEGPRRNVTIAKSFSVGVFEVTWNEWNACVRDGDCAEVSGKGFAADNGWGMADRPVINVSWHDAQQYVAWLRRVTGENYRLLSEAEWEYIARAGTDNRYPFDGDEQELCTYANGADLATDFNNRNEECFDGVGRETARVGSFEANAFGLYDTVGNVWEWTGDCWNETYEGAPSDGSTWDTGDCSQRMLRGGSWGSYPHDMRAATRYEAGASYRGHEVGFRVAVDR